MVDVVSLFHLNYSGVYLTVVLTHICLMTNDIEHFPHLVTICLSSIVKCPFKSSAQFLLGLTFYY